MEDKTSKIRLARFILLALLCPALAKATIGPIGPEIHVKQTVAGNQSISAATMNNSVVLWQSDDSHGDCFTCDYYIGTGL